MTVSTRKLTTASMFSALAIILMLLSQMIPDVAGFLQFDVKDVAIVTGGFILGPVYALFISVVVAFVEMITVSHTGLIGFIMNIVATSAFAVTASSIYRVRRTLAGALWGLGIGTIALTVVMILWNYYVTPLYMQVPREVVAAMLPTVFLPFNLVKGCINSALSLLVYRSVVNALRKLKLIEHSSQNAKKPVISVFVIGFVLLAIFVPVLLHLIGII